MPATVEILATAETLKTEPISQQQQCHSPYPLPTKHQCHKYSVSPGVFSLPYSPPNTRATSTLLCRGFSLYPLPHQTPGLQVLCSTGVFLSTLFLIKHQCHRYTLPTGICSIPPKSRGITKSRRNSQHTVKTCKVSNNIKITLNTQ
jgi:hypothetical protein